MMVGLFDNQKDWHIAAQMGVANYGQMTPAAGCISVRRGLCTGRSIPY